MRLKKISMVISCCRECPYLQEEEDIRYPFCTHTDYRASIASIKDCSVIPKKCPLEDINMPVGFTQLDHDKD